MKRRVLMLLLLPLALSCCGLPANNPEPLSSPTYEKALAILQTQAHAVDPAARAQSLEALQVSRDPRALETIEEGLHDREWVVRFAAAMAAGERKAAGMRPVLNTLVVHDPNLSVRVGCVYALRRLGDETHLNDLAAAIEAADSEVRANTALVLGKMADKTGIVLLQRYRSDPDVRVRFAVTAALARLGDEPAIKVIVSEVVNKYAEDQYNSMEVCADLPESVGSSPLLLGLEDMPSKLPPDVDAAMVKYLTTCRQLVAARSLAKMKYNSQRAAEVAITNRENADPRLRALAALALGEMLSSREAVALDKMLEDPDEGVRRAVAAAVVNIYARAARGK